MCIRDRYITTRTPFVTLKLATTLDGFIADTAGKSKWITGAETRKLVHQWRAWSDAVMVGVGTVLADDPSLTVRDAAGKDPLRIIVDSFLRTPTDAKVLADDNVLIAVSDGADPDSVKQFRGSGVDVVTVEGRDGRVSLPSLMTLLGEREVTSVLCEGGSALAGSLLREHIADKIVFTMAPAILGDGLHALTDTGASSLDEAVRLADVETETIDGDIVVTGYLEYANG